jgi:hypothetical protein
MPLLCAAALILLTSCGDPDPGRPGEGGDPYQADLEVASSNATSAHLKAILTDGNVDDSEYESSVNGYVDCVNKKFSDLDTPFRKTRKSSGLYSFTFTGPTELVKSQHASDIQDICFEEFMGDAALIYEARRKNPRRLSGFDLVKNCLTANGLVPESYSEKNWEADQYHDALAAGAVIDGEGAVPNERDATSFDVTSEEAMKCQGGR